MRKRAGSATWLFSKLLRSRLKKLKRFGGFDTRRLLLFFTKGQIQRMVGGYRQND
jgi:hypothetical protein